MKKLKTSLKYLVAFILGLVVGIFSEDKLHQFIRFLYTYLTNNRISFYIPKFDLYFFSVSFIILFGLYFVALLYLFIGQTLRQRLLNFFLTLIFIISSFFLICYMDANMKLIECTACNDGKRILDYYDINYLKIFIGTLLSSLIPNIWFNIRNRRKQNNNSIKSQSDI